MYDRATDSWHEILLVTGMPILAARIVEALESFYKAKPVRFYYRRTRTDAYEAPRYRVCVQTEEKLDEATYDVFAEQADSYRETIFKALCKEEREARENKE